MLSGETRVSKGELIYDDWLYDDYGADLDQAPNQPAFRAALAPTQGDYRYPTNSARYGYNAADLRELRVAADGYGLHLARLPPDDEGAKRGRLHARDRLRARPRRHRPVARRRRHRRAQGATTSSPRGAPAASSRTASGSASGIPRQAVNLAENAIEVDVPWQRPPHARAQRRRLYMVSGLADPAAHAAISAAAGSADRDGGRRRPARLDRRLRRRVRPERGVHPVRESLGRRGPIAVARTAERVRPRPAVDFGALEAGSSDGYAPAPGRFYNRIFRSDQDYGEGISLKNPTGPPRRQPRPAVPLALPAVRALHPGRATRPARRRRC